MLYLIQPNILLSATAERRAKEQGINNNQIASTIQNPDHSESIQYNTYKKRRLFSSTQILVYCKWEESKQRWFVTSCFKKLQ